MSSIGVTLPTLAHAKSSPRDPWQPAQELRRPGLERMINWVRIIDWSLGLYIYLHRKKSGHVDSIQSHLPEGRVIEQPFLNMQSGAEPYDQVSKTRRSNVEDRVEDCFRNGSPVHVSRWTGFLEKQTIEQLSHYGVPSRFSTVKQR
jgi:hypothetical protein